MAQDMNQENSNELAAPNVKIGAERLQEIKDIASSYISSDKTLLEQFVEVYYRGLHRESADNITTQNLAGMALHHFTLLQRYDRKSPQLAVINPLAEEHHFYSSHTVIQMVAYDRPFLVDTILMTLESRGINVHRIYNTIIGYRRDENGDLIEVNYADSSDASHLSLIHCEIDRQDDEVLAEIHQALLAKINTLDVVVADWPQMQAQLQNIKQELSTQPMPEAYYSREEIQAFLEWILDDHFIFLGFREYRLQRDGSLTEVDIEDAASLELYSVGGSGLGLLRSGEEDERSESFHQLPDSLKHLLTIPRVLLLSKSSHVSPVHRSVYMDFLGIHKFDEEGNLIGEYRFVGLLTSQAYQLTVQQIPLLREKANSVLAMADLPKRGHAYHKMMHIINTLPRDDLFQANIDELYPIVSGISQLQDKKKLRLFARIDHYQRFVSCLVYIPRNKFNTELRLKVQKQLVEAYGGTSSEFTTEFNESDHARVHVHVRTVPGKIKHVDINQLEEQLTRLMVDWQDKYESALLESVGEKQANSLLRKYSAYIPAAYQESFDVQSAVADTKRLLRLSAQQPIIWHLYHSTGDLRNQLHLKLYGLDKPAILSNVLPNLENFGVAVVSAQTYEFDIPEQPVWMQEYELRLRHVDAVELDLVRSQFEDSLQQIWQGRVESDRLNELILTTKLDTYDVVVLRALSRYMIQARAPFSNDYVQQALVKNADIAVMLIDLFHARMDPIVENRQQQIQAAQNNINEALKHVESLDEDRIIHWYLDLLAAMIRTNFYQREADGTRKDRLSFKFKAADIPHLPKPKPMFEIYVYSPRVEAVHLRGGKVARGGLRWSDRMEDFRTEVLGLVKAQMVKNTVIVPVGSKGGFIVKNRPKTDDREAIQKEGIACYQTFIRGMLDITDNIVDGEVVAPENTMRYDEDDPYLVVAADKGTASFSDIANALSAEYNFWLDDAFASGGSVGYDHKGMAITARGAWESVKRHFRLMGKDIQAEDEFTVVGIGDMSGDVFGNGMLLSKNIRLQAAFNHLHIFIDPNPDAASSYAERERLFNLPRSNWSDYDASLISEGGGIFSRQDKSITLTPQMQEAFAISAETLTPDELLHELLKAPVDLIWNGGIGTYVKSSEEDHADVGDRANDSIRVNGRDVRANIIGEGGNLGCTQRGRIEYAQNGGRIYTDAIDNSGGVNCSDHEVNIKILLGAVVAQGDMTVKQRNELLESMTDPVAELVLRQNYLQPQTIEMSASETTERLSENQRMMQMLEQQGRLDRSIEYLPSDEEIAQREKEDKGLTNPELAVLLAYGKMWVYDELLASDLPDEPYFLNELRKYFPDVLDTPYFEQMTQHRLHREIISTYLTNGLVNRLGIETVFRLTEETGQGIATITRAYAVARDVFDAYQPWRVLEELDNQVDAHLQIELEHKVRQVLKRGMVWFINANGQKLHVTQMIENFQNAVQEVVGNEALLEAHFANSVLSCQEDYEAQGLTKAQAQVFARLPTYVYALDVVQLSQQSAKPMAEVAEAYFSIHDALNMGWLLQHTDELPQQSYWDRRANNALSNEFNKTLRDIVRPILKEEAVETAVTQWQQQNQDTLQRLTSSAKGMEGSQVKLSALSVLLSEMNALKSQD